MFEFNCKYQFSKYSQTWVNDHLRIATTCLQRSQFKGPILDFTAQVTSEQRPPVNNGHYFGVPKVVVVYRFDFLKFTGTGDQLLQSTILTISTKHCCLKDCSRNIVVRRLKVLRGRILKTSWHPFLSLPILFHFR